MTRDSHPSAFSASTAARVAASSSGTTTSPSASIRSGTSSRRSRGTNGSNEPSMPYGFGRVRRPSSSTSRNPLVVIRPQRLTLRSSSALVVVVVP